MSLVWDDESFAKVEALLSPKQLKVVNFMFGQVMKADPNMRKANPSLIKRLLIQRLSEATYEEEPVE